MDAKEITCWQCSSCGRIYVSKDLAEECCVCRTCGKPISKGKGYNRECSDCYHKRMTQVAEKRYQDAHKVSWEDYDGAMVYSELTGEYYDDFSPEYIRDAWEASEEAPYPGYGAMQLYGTSKHMIELEASRIQEDIESGDVYEGYEFTPDMERDLEEFCKAWNAKHADASYYPDYSVAITEGDHDV